MRHWAFILACVLFASTAFAQPAAAPAEVSAENKAEAKARFERGMGLVAEGAWDAALAEFLRSRELFPSKGNTKNAAMCLDKLHRYDEALDLFEEFMTKFQVSPDERAAVEKEIEQLRARIGRVEVVSSEPGARVMIDGRPRGVTPLSAPIRVAAGSHIVRVYKDGFAPFEASVTVAGQETTTMRGALLPLRDSGTLKITEERGRAVDVLVDNVVVGKTPWEGQIATGDHAVVLRGAGTLGTQPARAPVHTNQLTSITLMAETLDGELRVEPEPAQAVVEIDGVSVGRGLWDGRVRLGEHRIEVAAEGFLSARRQVTVGATEHPVVAVRLERDRTSALWSERRARFIVELEGSGAVAPSLGGPASSCAGSCTASLGVGAIGMIRGGYELGSGIGFTLDLGYATVQQKVTGRAADLTPRGLSPDHGTLDETVSLHGVLVGASASFRAGDPWTLGGRLGAGALLGTASDTRAGTFTASLGGAPYAVGPIEEGPKIAYLHVTPEVLVGRRIGAHFEVALSMRALILFAVSQPEWKDQQPVLAGNCAPGSNRCEGLAQFGTQSMTSAVTVLLSPGIAARAEF